MHLTFSDIVDGIRQLPVEGKAELRELLDHELIAASAGRKLMRVTPRPWPNGNAVS